MNLNIILAIFRKDLISSVKNKNILLILLTPVFLSVLFTSAVSLSDDVVVPIALYDDGSSTDFLEHLQAIENYDIIVVKSIEMSENLLYNDEVAVALVLPKRFSADLKKGLRPSLEITVNPYNTRAIIFLQNYKDVIMEFAEEEYPVYISLDMLPAGLQSRANIPVWVMFTIIFVGILVLPNTLTTEKEKKTLDAILVSPASEIDVLCGKLLFGLFLTISASLFIIIINGGFIGNFPLALLFIILGSGAFIGLGLLIASYAENYSSASLLSTILMAPLILLVLLADLSPELGYVSYLVPSTYMFWGIKDAMLNNSGISDLYPWLMVLVMFNIAVYVVTGRVLRKKSYT